MGDIIEQIFCIKCKEKTDSNNIINESKTDKNGKIYNILKATCTSCGCRKNKFAKSNTVNDVQSGR